MLKRIDTDEDVSLALDAACARDPLLAQARAVVPAVELRRRPADLAGLLRIVTGQQLSVASANAVWRRFEAAFDPNDARAIAAAGDDALKAPGLSRQKIKTFRAAASAVEAGLDVPALSHADPGEARATLLAIPGVGPWTADIMLMFCAGHPDILPVGDLAVRKAAERLLRCGPLTEAGFAEIGERWAPHRAAVARLLWAYYKVPDDGAQSARMDSDVQGYPL